MIDFKNGTYVKLSPSTIADAQAQLAPLLVDEEEIRLSFSSIRDSVVFTDKRLIATNVQGMTGKKRDYSSLPYSKVQAWSVETAGSFDRDAELELWFSGLGKVRLEFKGKADIRGIGRLIGEYVL